MSGTRPKEALMVALKNELQLVAGLSSSVTFYSQILTGLRKTKRETLVVAKVDGRDYFGEIAAKRWENGLRALELAEVIESSGLRMRRIDRYRRWAAGDFTDEERKCEAQKGTGRVLSAKAGRLTATQGTTA